MRKKTLLCFFVQTVFAVLTICVSPGFVFAATGDILHPTMKNSANFVPRAGQKLLLNGTTFRFAGANLHWLPMNDDTLYPSQFEINDGLDTATGMGLTVVRSHDLGVSTGCGNCIEPALGVFNETALEHDDYVIKAAGDRGLKLIIPLTDNYHYPAGGKHNFTDWRGITDENQFYTNPQVIADFEKYISVLLNRVNIYTGIAYKNDPTIMAWETGNELYPPTSWTQTISTFIKSIDKNHLVLDGSARIDPKLASLSKVDIASNHYYPKNISRLTSDAALANQAGKAFIVGEYDWNDANGGDTLSNFLGAIEKNSNIMGDAFWELWPHDDQYGYVPAEVKYMLHYPGDTPTMLAATQTIRTHAYKMSGQAVPPPGTPGVPLIDGVIRNPTTVTLTWRGTALAASYTVERSTVSGSGPWTTICNRCATDNNTPWTDSTPPNTPLWYRVTAFNLAGGAGNPSAPYLVNPLPATAHTLVDDLNDWSKVYAHSSNLTFDTTNTAYMNNDPSRACRSTATNEWIVWRQQNMLSFQMTSYFWPYEPISDFSFYTSTDGNTWQAVLPSTGLIHGVWSQYIYMSIDVAGANYIKVMWNNTTGHYWNPQVGQVVIGY